MVPLHFRRRAVKSLKLSTQSSTSLLEPDEAEERKDGRLPEELRKVIYHKGSITGASGSASVESVGSSSVYVAVYGPVRWTAHEVEKRKCLVGNHGNFKVSVRLAAYSQGALGRRSKETEEQEHVLEEILLTSLGGLLRLEEYPQTTISLHAYVGRRDSNQDTAAHIINCSIVAFLDSGLSLNGLLSALTFGSMPSGDLWIDLAPSEFKLSEATGLVCFCSVTGNVSQLHVTGALSSLSSVLQLCAECSSSVLENIKDVFERE